MQILSSRAVRSSLPLSNAVKKQMGIQSEELRCGHKNQHLPTHDLSLKQTVMYQEQVSKNWYPAKITRLCDEPRSYIITTEEGTQYRKTQAHLKLYQPQHQKTKQELKLNKDTQFNDNHIRLRPRKASNSKGISLKVDLNKRNQVLYSKCIHIYIVHKKK